MLILDRSGPAHLGRARPAWAGPGRPSQAAFLHGSITLVCNLVTRNQFIVTKLFYACKYNVIVLYVFLGPRKIAPVDAQSKPISLETAMVAISNYRSNYAYVLNDNIKKATCTKVDKFLHGLICME